MNDIKLFIGKNEPLDSKLPWLPNLDSVLSTQIYIKNKYLYKTIIIFRTETEENYNYPMLVDMLYTNSNTDYLTQHLGTDEYITMNGYYFYFDGNYYYSYLVMYSNTFDEWNVTNDNTVYAVLYNQTSVKLTGGAPYIMNEHKITKNVEELIVTGGEINNIETLILPNKTVGTTTFKTYSLVTSCKKFQLFDEVNQISNQQVNTLNGLLYTTDYTTLLAVPINFQMDLNNDLTLTNYCTTINSNAFSESPENKVLNQINTLYGFNVEDILDYGLAFIELTSFYMPRLKGLGFGALLESLINRLNLPNTLISMEDNSVQACENLIGIYLQVGIKGIIDLRGANNIDGAILSLQLYNVADLRGLPESYIYLNGQVYDNITLEAIKYCEERNWVVIRL